MHWRALCNLSDKCDNSNELINLDVHWRSFHCLPFPEQKKIKLAPSILRRRNLKTLISTWKCIKCFPFTLRWRNWKPQQSPVISSLGLCLRKTCAGKSHPGAIVFKMFSVHKKMENWRFQIPPVLRAFSNRSRTVGIKLHYLIPPALFGRCLNLVDRESSFFLVKCTRESESEGEIYFVM